MKTYDRVFEKLFVFSKKQKAGHLEIFLIETKTLEIRYFKDELEHFAANEAAGVSIRLFRDDREGFAYSEDLSDHALEDLALKAIEIAKLGPLKEGIDKEGKKISIGSLPLVPNIYNSGLSKVDLQQKMDLARSIETTAVATDSKVTAVPYSGYMEQEIFTRVGTLEGVGRSYRKNAAAIFCNPLLAHRGDRKEAFEVQVSNSFDLLNPISVAEKAVGNATDKLGAGQISSGQYTIIIDRKMMAELIQAFSPIFSAKRVQEHQSVLTGKEEKKIVNQNVTIVDDALLSGGYSARPFDHEGTLSKQLTLIDGGVLSGLMHNRETAAKAGASLTGHATRSLKSDVGIAPTNMYLKNGTIKVEDLLSAEKKCIFIVDLQGFHSGTNPVSGDFSLGAQGFLYKKGKRNKPIHNFTVSGNILQMLSSGIVLGDDYIFQPSLGDSSFGAPSVLVSEMKLSGK